jgi:integrase
MATITRIKSPKGAVSFRAQVRLAKFKSAAKTFKVETQGRAAEKSAEKAAHEWALALEKELRDQSKHSAGARRDLTQLTIGGLIAEYQADPVLRAERKTFETDIIPLTDWWVNKFGAEKVLDFGELTLLEARRRLLTPGRSASTVNRYLSQMRACWNWGREHKLILNRTWPEMQLMLKEPKGRDRFLTDDEITALLKAAEADPVLRAAIVVSIGTGLRQGELLALKWSDIDLTRGEVIVRESKNDTRRGVHLPPVAVEALEALKKAKVVSPVFPFINAAGKALRKSWLEVRWRKVRTAANLSNFRWHDLRHTCASILAQDGATLLQIGSVLGHKSASMTLRYSHLVQGKALPAHAAFDVKLRGTTQKQ